MQNTGRAGMVAATGNRETSVLLQCRVEETYRPSRLSAQLPIVHDTLYLDAADSTGRCSSLSCQYRHEFDEMYRSHDRAAEFEPANNRFEGSFATTQTQAKVPFSAT